MYIDYLNGHFRFLKNIRLSLVHTYSNPVSRRLYGILRNAWQNPDCKLYGLVLMFFNHASPSALRRIGLDSVMINRFIEERDRRVKSGRWFRSLADIEQAIFDRFHKIGPWKAPTTIRSMLIKKMAERLGIELELIEPIYDNKPLLLNFLTGPMRSIQRSHAEI